MEWLTNLFERTLIVSLEAALMVLLLALVTAAFRSKLVPMWKYALWTLLVVKLLMPWLPGNIESELRWTIPLAGMEERIFSIENLEASIIGSYASGISPITHTDQADSNLAQSHPPASQERLATKIPGFQIAVFVWLAGTAAVLLYIAAGYLRMSVALQRETNIQIPADLVALFVRIRADNGILAKIRLRVTKQVSAPALFGVFSPTVLIPEQMVKHLNAADWECVFLHELSHYKRRDILVNVAATMLASFHWFNPAVWYGLRNMRLHQETACDASVLNVLTQKDTYAACILKILELGKFHRTVSAGAGITGYKNQIARRIIMIRNFQSPKKRAWFFGLLILVLAAALSLPSAFASGNDKEAAETPNEHIPVQAAIDTSPANDAFPSQAANDDIRFVFPTTGKIVSRYGERIHPITQEKSLHEGIDIANVEGTEIRAAADGKVIKAEYDPEHGFCVIIEHNEIWQSEYRHLQQLSITVGDETKSGDLIGLMGSTGQSTGSHLHFSIIKDTNYVDPTDYLK
ncbi:M23/M56 family metallopeptidase [Paenibacillus sp. MY03]|uniref:M23/M56 family metallopeptidase n=1 Tax=Paenibacillus sp. MY03 TaxID=302980 RepID=UPI00211AF28F|nr:M23/M56 family metallopeptidase [Paenibacillus sp. MY03]